MDTDSARATSVSARSTACNDARTAIPIVLAMLSLAIYAAAVLSLRQERTGPFLVEENGPIPVVISHWLYGTPFGLTDSGVHKFFVQHFNSRGHNASEALEHVLQGAATPTRDLSVPNEGTGVGGPIVVELAFLLFGPHACALPMLFVLLIVASGTCFVARYRDERLSAIPIVVLALTLLLVTPLSAPPSSIYAQAPIGGIRYYAVIGIIPALHWCFDFRENGTWLWPPGLMRWALLCVQTTILGLSILVRGSPLYLLIPVVISAWLALRSQPVKLRRRLILIRLLVPAAALLIGIRVLVPLAFPDYANTGRVFPTVWHRVFVSLGVHPAWPFAGLVERYTCPPVGDHLRPGTGDHNGYCVWWDFGRSHGLSDSMLSAQLYSPGYESVLRAAFFDIVRAYLWKTCATFIYYKPKQTLQQIANTLQPQWSSTSRSVLVLAALQMMLFVVVAMRFVPAPLRDAARRARVLGLFLIPSLIPQWIVWTVPWTAVDLFTYVLCGCIIALWLVVSYGVRVVTTWIGPAARPDSTTGTAVELSKRSGMVGYV